MGKTKIRALVLSQEELAPGIYSMWLQTGSMAREARPGQFIAVYSSDRSRLLPRPISICETDGERLRIVYRVAGRGTEEFSGARTGDSLEVMGPLGNGYPLQSGHAVLAAGGIGIPPMLELARTLEGEKTIVLGYRDTLFLNREFEKYGRVILATEDGSQGIHGNVLDAIRREGIEGDVLYSCGPLPMLRALKAYAQEKEIPAWISLEERMACGIGACLACVCGSEQTDAHTNVHNKRICKDGPVFNAQEVVLG